ncbi:unnamed protein product [Didymodactylos carnosus]|uniref:Uncharacterized protein n=1 Tax=Didymodactylos carnosus TaxID=1234261 RepID=A0A815SG15_9BILA|nr:unnamed protein product [Didymodactylos carnosus]CAF4352962.1 unnamed protein product [Didymodactylos carnosus]
MVLGLLLAAGAGAAAYGLLRRNNYQQVYDGSYDYYYPYDPYGGAGNYHYAAPSYYPVHGRTPAAHGSPHVSSPTGMGAGTGKHYQSVANQMRQYMGQR